MQKRFLFLIGTCAFIFFTQAQETINSVGNLTENEVYVKKSIEKSEIPLFDTQMETQSDLKQNSARRASEVTDFFNDSVFPVDEVNLPDFHKGTNSDLYYGIETVGVVFKSTVDNPFPGTQLAAAGKSIECMEYINGTIYACTFTETGSVNSFGTIDKITGVYTMIKNFVEYDAISLCWNPVNNLVYITQWGRTGYGVIDLATGNYTQIGSLVYEGLYSAAYMAIDNHGIAYVIFNETSKFGALDLRTGEFTLIAHLPFRPQYVQGLSIDRETDELYWMSRTWSLSLNAEITRFYRVDKITGELTLIASSSNPAIATNSMCIITTVELCEPVQALDINVEGNNVELSWQPVQGATGYEVIFNNNVLETVTNTSFTHSDVEVGVHKYGIKALHDDDCFLLTLSQTVQVGDFCQLTFGMTSTYPLVTLGYGWSEAGIYVFVDGKYYGFVTLEWGNYGVADLFVPSGEVSFVWKTDMFTGNNGHGADHQYAFEIYNSNYELIYHCPLNQANTYTNNAVFFTYENDCNYTPPVDCSPATDLSVEFTSQCNAQLTWGRPYGYEGWIKQCVNDDVYGKFGWSETAGNDMIAAIRFFPSDLYLAGVKYGDAITKVSLGMGTELNNITTMEIMIWEGGGAVTDPGTLVYTQAITNYTSFTSLAMNEITLTTPHAIDITKELRIGYRIVNTAGTPYGYDVGPVAIGKGDLLFCEDVGGWKELVNLINNWNSNFSLKAWVTSSYKQDSYAYNIYRDGELIAQDITTTSFLDDDFDIFTEHTWAVTIICDNEDGESTPEEITKLPCRNDCDPIINLEAVYNDDCDAELTWDEPIMCPFKFLMYDMGSNGWDGAYIEVFANDRKYATVTLTEGYSAEETVWLPPGEVKFYWFKGTADSEVMFYIHNPNNTQIYFGFSLGDDFSGLFLTYQNTCSLKERNIFVYNVYRDDILIASDLTETNYTDIGFNPNAGHTWAVTITCENGGQTYPVEITKLACFEINTYTVAVSANPEEGGVVTGGDEYNYGATATVAATENDGYKFVNWTNSENGNLISSFTTYSFTVNEDVDLTANFTIKSYTITVSANPEEGGIVNGGNEYNHGENVTVTATANDNYEFVNWTNAENGNLISSLSIYSFTAQEDIELVANFGYVNIKNIGIHHFEIYPNPVRDELRIRNSVGAKDFSPIQNIQIFDVYGRNVVGAYGIRPLMERPLMERPLTEPPLTECPLMERPLTERPLTESQNEIIIDVSSLSAGVYFVVIESITREKVVFKMIKK